VKKAFLPVMLMLFALTLSSQALTEGAYANAAFVDHFDGTALDPAKWVVQENTNMTAYPAYGGSVEVANSHVVLSSTGSGFPCVTSAVNPFPTTGDFTIVFEFTYTCISDWGNGLWFSVGPFVAERNTSNSNVIFQLWAGNLDYDQAAIFVNLMGKQVYRTIVYGWEPSASTQTFKLQYSGETYILFIDDIEVASTESDMRPDTIGFGHPPAYYLPFSPSHVGSVIGGWSSFTIDYIKLLEPTSISVSTSALSTQLGFSVTINGTLDTIEGEPLTNANVILSYRVSGDAQWNTFASATTEANGAFSATWHPTATGTFNVKAAWSGNETHSGASDTKDISVIRGTGGETLFYVESNSTLSSLAFNSTTKEISFTASGPSGSTGYVSFLISKSLMGNATDFRVYLDGQEIQCSITELSDSLLIFFQYTHSTHDVLIRLPASAIPELPPWVLLPLLGACALLAFIARRKTPVQNV
jgi:hypothetical protein